MTPHHPVLPPLVGPVPTQPVTRFAPSPTGYLHLGHVAHAVYVWGVAHRAGGAVLLRLEDHDRGRFRPTFEQGILDDLEWLGLIPDAGTLESVRSGPSPYRQSDRGERYEAAVAGFGSEVYRCACSRRDIARRGEAPVPGHEVRYPGTCRHRGLAAGPDRGLRLCVPDETIEFVDLLQGPQRQAPHAQAGDLLLRDRHGNWTYQFAVTVDDTDQAVSLIIRGLDLMSSTGRQIQLARRLGRADPLVFLHHPLLVDGGGRKLSKRDAATGIRDLRGAGVEPPEVLGRAAHAAGLLTAPVSLRADDLPDLFDRWF